MPEFREPTEPVAGAADAAEAPVLAAGDAPAPVPGLLIICGALLSAIISAAIVVTIAAAVAHWRLGILYLSGAAALTALVVGAVVLAALTDFLMRARNRNSQFQAVLGNMSQGLLMFDSAMRLVVCNERYRQMYGLPAEAVQPGRTLAQLLADRAATGTFSRDPAGYIAELRTALGRRTPVRSVMELPDRRVIEVVNHPMRGGGWVATHEDITERRRAEQERDRNRAFLDLVIDNVPAGIFVKDAGDKTYALINRAGEEHLGVPRSELIGKTSAAVFPPEAADFINRADQEALDAGEVRILDGHSVAMPGKGERFVITTRLPIMGADGKPQYLLIVLNDITERKRAEDHVAHMAHHDTLTGLANRASFCTELDQALARVQRGEQIAVLYLDLDHFKRVNDTRGHAAGDELLQQVADRLRDRVRESDLIARLGGDEFAVLQTRLEQPSDAAALARRIERALRDPFDIAGEIAHVGVSIGIAIAPDDALDRDQLLKNADLALYGAKESGRGTYHFYEPELDTRIKNRQKLESDLRTALTEGQFELYYQPIVNLRTNGVSACEALLRWHHPERGLVSPAEFIPVAEETGIIRPLGEWVLRQACADAAKWPDDIRVAVNLSPAQLKAGNLVHVATTALAASGLPARRLELEITESVLMQNTFATLSTLHRLRQLGVHIALDDFGTGYSSLSYLRSFPFDKIKIDRSFIENITENDGCVTIVQAVTTMAHRLNMTTVAEGIETTHQRQKVLDLGCTEMQGYLFSRPAPVAECAKRFLASRDETETAAVA